MESLQKNALIGLGVLGAGALALAGYLNIDTTKGAQCAVDLSAYKVRAELFTIAATECRTSLMTCDRARGGGANP